jgi:hypothetical protein
LLAKKYNSLCSNRYFFTLANLEFIPTPSARQNQDAINARIQKCNSGFKNPTFTSSPYLRGGARGEVKEIKF